MSSNSIVIQKFISLGKLNPNYTNWSEADLQGLKEVAPHSNYNRMGVFGERRLKI